MAEKFQLQHGSNELISAIMKCFSINKEIFLREIISNSSDALDKIRYQSLTNKDALSDDPQLHIQIIPDKANKTLTIQDSGIGMTKADLVNNLGAISGRHRHFLQAAQGSDIALLAQYGVGFYGAYLVADRVSVISKHNDDETYCWESSAGGTFTVARAEQQRTRGTSIVLHLKEDQQEYLEERRLKDLIKKHADFINYDIELFVEKEIEEDFEEPEGSNNNQQKKRKKSIKQFEKQNLDKPLWTRDPKDINKDEYAAFYKAISKDWEEHLAVKHFSVEGQLEYRCMLFIPKRASLELYDPDGKVNNNNIQLYVRRNRINDEHFTAEDLCPEWLGFIKGVVDSEDLPLNVEKDSPHQNKILKVMKKNIVKNAIELMEEIANGLNNQGEYLSFYQQFRKHIKLGVHRMREDVGGVPSMTPAYSLFNRLLELLLYRTTASSGPQNCFATLNSYVLRIPESQVKNNIYYLLHDDWKRKEDEELLMEEAKKQGVEILFADDAIDEMVFQKVGEYDGKKFVNFTAEFGTAEDLKGKRVL